MSFKWKPFLLSINWIWMWCYFTFSWVFDLWYSIEPYSIEPIKLSFNWMQIMLSQIFLAIPCNCGPGAWHYYFNFTVLEMFAWWPRILIRNNYRLDPDVPNRNVAIIKIESDMMSSNVSIKHNVGSVTSNGIKPHHSHLTPGGCSFNKLIILNKPNLSLSNKSSVNEQNSNINHNQSLDGHKRNSRSHR